MLSVKTGINSGVARMGVRGDLEYMDGVNQREVLKDHF